MSDWEDAVCQQIINEAARAEVAVREQQAEADRLNAESVRLGTAWEWHDILLLARQDGEFRKEVRQFVSEYLQRKKEAGDGGAASGNSTATNQT